MTDIRSQLEVTWIEEPGRGFPAGSTGETMQDQAIASITGGELRQPRLVTQEGGIPLTDIQLDSTIGFAEFLAGSAFTDSERGDLHKALVADFGSNPVQATAAFEQIVNAFIQIPGMDPERRAMERQGAWANTTLAERRAGIVTPSSELIERYNPILHVDTESSLVMTGDALDAYWSSYDLIATLVGVEPSTSGDHVTLATHLPEAYATWAPRVRSEMSFARGRWVALRAAIRSMDDVTYEGFRATLVEQVDGPDGVAAAVTGFGMAAGAAAQARRISRRLAPTPTDR